MLPMQSDLDAADWTYRDLDDTTQDKGLQTLRPKCARRGSDPDPIDP